MRPENISTRSRSRSSRQDTTKAQRQNLIVVAIPYYGQLVRQNGGLEHIYFKLAINKVTGEYTKPKLSVWNQKELPSLPDWLCQQGIEAVLCSDNRPGFEGLFSASGISLVWNQRGEVDAMVIQWLRTLPPEQRWQQHRIAFA